MTTTGLDVVRCYRDFVVSDRFPEALELLSDQLEFLTPDGKIHTRADLADMWSDAPEFENLTLEVVPRELHDVGEDRYLGESDQVFRWKETGEISNVERRAMLFDVAGGKIRRMELFVKAEAAWAKAGVARP